MAKTIAQWKKVMTDEFIANESVISYYGLVPGQTFEQQFSTVSLESILFYAVAFALFTIDKLFDNLKSIISAMLLAQKAHTARWYVNKLLAYQHGKELIQDKDTYDNTGLSDDQIVAMQIIKSATAEETETFSLLFKVKSEDGTMFNQDQINGIKAYIKEIKDLGVPYELRNAEADSIRLVYDIYYDAKILNSAGARLDGSSATPVLDAINAFIQALKFDGYFVNLQLTNSIMSVDGVGIAELRSAQSRYGSYEYADINARVQPWSGWFKIYNASDVVLNFIPA